MWSSSTLANPNERYLPYKICFDPISKSEATFLRDSKHTTRQSCPSLSRQPCLVAYYPAPGGEMDSRDVVIVTSRGIWLCQQDDESMDDRVVATNEEPNDWLSSATNSNDIFVATCQGVKAFHLVSGKCTNTHLPFKQQDELKKTRNWAKCEGNWEFGHIILGIYSWLPWAAPELWCGEVRKWKWQSIRKFILSWRPLSAPETRDVVLGENTFMSGACKWDKSGLFGTRDVQGIDSLVLSWIRVLKKKILHQGMAR